LVAVGELERGGTWWAACLNSPLWAWLRGELARAGERHAAGALEGSGPGPGAKLHPTRGVLAPDKMPPFRPVLAPSEWWRLSGGHTPAPGRRRFVASDL